MRRAIGDVRRDFANMQSTFDKAPEGWEAWRRGLRGIGDASLLVSGHLGGLSTRMFALGQIVREYGVGIGIAAGGMVALGVAINGVSSKVIDTTIQIQKAEKALTAITRSSAAAGVEIDFVRHVANNSGQVFTSLTDTYSRFLASANSSGQILNETHRQFATVSQAAGILGLSVEDTQGVFRAMEQMLSKGTVQAEELRGQLGDRLPGAFAIGAQAMGVTTQKLGDLMKKGEVLSADFLPKFTSQLAKVFNVDITKPVEGIVAAQNRLKNAMDQFYLSVDKSSGVTKIYQVVLEGFTVVMVTLTNNLQTVAQVVGALAGAFVGLGIAMMVPAAFALFGAMAGWIGTVISLARTITSLAEAVALFNAALMLT
ncbi:tape measure protein, partial [Parvimonas sp. D9]|uniref:tape measure protein n=2 Tax=Parvimonas TaxID=543311 RepID=UPI002B47BC53